MSKIKVDLQSFDNLDTIHIKHHLTNSIIFIFGNSNQIRIKWYSIG